jgi:hypothetical protein
MTTHHLSALAPTFIGGFRRSCAPTFLSEGGLHKLKNKMLKATGQRVGLCPSSQEKVRLVNGLLKNAAKIRLRNVFFYSPTTPKRPFGQQPPSRSHCLMEFSHQTRCFRLALAPWSGQMNCGRSSAVVIMAWANIGPFTSCAACIPSALKAAVASRTNVTW